MRIARKQEMPPAIENAVRFAMQEPQSWELAEILNHLTGDELDSVFYASVLLKNTAENERLRRKLINEPEK